LLLWFMVFLLFVPFLWTLFGGNGNANDIPLTQVISDVKEEKIDQIEVSGNQLNLTYEDGTLARSRIETGGTLTETLQNAGVDISTLNISVVDQSSTRFWFDLLATLLPILLMAVFF